MAIKYHIGPRGKQGVLQLRLVVPKRLRAVAGRREFIKTLGTTDRREAERRALPLLHMWKSELETLEAQQHEPQDLSLIAVEVGYEQLSQRLDAARKVGSIGADIRRQIERRETGFLEIVRRYRDNDLSIFESIADRSIKRRNLTVSKGSADYDKFVREIAEVVIDTTRLDLSISRGELSAEPKSKLIKQQLERKAAPAELSKGLMELFEQYAAQRLLEKRKRPDSIAQDRKVVASFVEFVGRARSPASIVKGDVREWIDLRSSLPPNFEKMSRFKGLALPAAAKRAETEQGRRVSQITLNRYLSELSPFFDWLIRRDYHAGPNPCLGLSFDVQKGKNPRPPFSTEQLNAILNSPLFTGFLCDGEEWSPGDMQARDWRFWIPLICLFTGARVSEIAQLKIADVRREDGIDLIFLVHDEQEGQSTKSARSRIVPVHDKLADIGFLDFCAMRSRSCSDTNAALFEGIEAYRRRFAGDGPSKWWRRYLAKIHIKANQEGGDGFGTHSFRHTIADRLRSEAELFDHEIAVALGHSIKSVTAGYGELRQGTAAMLKRMYDGVRFDGVSFDHLCRHSC